MDREAFLTSWFKKSIGGHFVRSSFARNVAVLAGGTALGQAISVLASPILTRLYTPADFGVLATYSSILSILSVIASWRYELAIPLPERDEDAVNLVALSLGIVVLMSCGVGVGVWLMGGYIVRWINAPTLEPYLWLFPVGVFLVGSYQVFNYWAVRKNEFGALAQTKLRQGIGAAVAQISMGLVKPSPLGLLLGQVLGQSAGLLALLQNFWKHVRNFWKFVDAAELAKLLSRYVRFPIFASWVGVLNTLSVQIPLVLLSALLDTKVTGFYLLAYRVLWLPIQLVSQATSQVLLSAGAEARRTGNIANLVVSVLKRLLLIGVPCFFVVGLLAPDIIAFIFGADWEKAGFFIQWLMPWIFIVFVTSPLSVFSIVLEKQSQEVFFQTILLISRTGALLTGWALRSPDWAIGLFSTASAICWIGYLIWILNLARVPLLRIGARLVFEEIAANLLFCLPLLLIKIFIHDSIWLLLAALVTLLLVTRRIVSHSSGEPNG